MARRIGCAVGSVLLFMVGALTALVWLVLSAVGVVGSAPFARVISGIGLLLGVSAVIAAVSALRRLTAPAARLVEAARRVEAGDYSARVPVRGPGELRSLARAFNAMSSRLEADEVRRRSVLADVAHELRTPLSIIRGQAEGVADGVYSAAPERMAPILAATRTLEVLVDDLRTLALAEAGSLRLEREPVDVAVLVNETLDAFRSAAAAAGVALVAEVVPSMAPADADPARLRGVLGNLLANALRHTPAGGTVHVAGAPGDARTVRVVVRDDGEGIPPDLLPRVFDRFVKGQSSTGSGLGLSIVRDVVEAHGGTVSAESTAGGGTAIAITLPAAPESM
jgi:two-component system sensor histidine kinase BaeS